jgi:dimethylamine--corrinoid protein Co-methyltransferase
MGGIKTAGDLVLRMQLAKGMRIGEAKRYVAGKLGVTEFELCDSSVMAEIRSDRGLGVQMPGACTPMGIAAKMRIAEALDIRINSVEVFKKKAGIEHLIKTCD